MQKWRRVWREGLVPNLSRAALVALQSALMRDDPRLLQGRVSSPAPSAVVRDCAVTLWGKFSTCRQFENLPQTVPPNPARSVGFRQ